MHPFAISCCILNVPHAAKDRAEQENLIQKSILMGTRWLGATAVIENRQGKAAASIEGRKGSRT